ncbi:MAG: cation:proton antiporter [Deltaproteobacteria bacterium]|nr:cation:proton antiporter [Deltaproteobacteria bacterium]
MQSFIILVGFFVFAVTLGRAAGKRAIIWFRTEFAWPSGFLGVTAMMVLLIAAGAEAVGIHAVLGSFLLGVMLAPQEDLVDEEHQVILQFTTSFFAAPVYFVSIGLKVDFINNFDLFISLWILFVACIGKIAGSAIGGWLGGMNHRQALALSAP